MEIKWNQVTWYSKLLAMLLFIALPFTGFLGGIWYEQATGPQDIVPRDQSTSGAAGGEIIGSALPGKELPKAITARTTVNFSPDKIFELQGLPNVTFRIQRISRISGGIPIDACGTGTYVYLPDPAGRSGNCVSESKLKIDGKTAALAVIDLEIKNNSNAYISSRFLQLFYNPQGGEEIQSRLADSLPSIDGYGALPQSSRAVRLGFLVPADQTQAQLVYGDYGKATGAPESQETLLGKSVGGWVLDFNSKALADIPG